MKGLFTRNFVLAFIALFTSTTVFDAYVAVMAEYSISIGIAESLSGVVVGLFLVGAMAARFVVGGSIDKYGIKLCCFVFFFVFLVCCIAYFFIKDFVPLSLLRFLHGFSYGLTSSAAMAVGLSAIPKERYNEGNAIFMLANTLALAVGPFVAGILYDWGGPSAVMIFTVISGVVGLACVLFLEYGKLESLAAKDEAAMKAKPKPKGFDAFIETRAIPVAICITIVGLAFSAIQSYYRLYAVEVDLVAAFSFFYVINAVTVLISRPPLGRVQDRFGDNYVVIPAIIIQCVSLLAVAIFPCTFSVFFCAVGCGLGITALIAAFNAIICRTAPDSRVAYAVSTFFLFLDLSTGLGAAVMGALITAIGFKWTLIVAGFLALASLPYYLVVWGRKPEAKVSTARELAAHEAVEAQFAEVEPAEGEGC